MARLFRQKGGDRVGATKRAKGTKLMVLVDGSGLPLAVDVDSASTAEANLLEPLIDESVTPHVPGRHINDRIADRIHSASESLFTRNPVTLAFSLFSFGIRAMPMYLVGFAREGEILRPDLLEVQAVGGPATKLSIDRATVVLEAESDVVKLAFEKLSTRNPQVSLLLRWPGDPDGPEA